jgi:dihydrofolate reductase
MRKVIALVNITLDGFAATADGGLDWTIVDDEMWVHTNELFNGADTTLFGRVTYQGFEQAWPAIGANPDSPKTMTDFAAWIENVEKIVFSRSLERVPWNHSRIVKDHIAEEVAKLKAQPGKDIVIMGSLSITRTFLNLGLLDELQLNINPVVLGSGIRLFDGSEDRQDLTLVKTKGFASGVVSVHYASKRELQ